MRKLFFVSLAVLLVGCYNAPAPQPVAPTETKVEVEINRPDHGGHRHGRPPVIVVPGRPAPPPIIVQPPAPPPIIVQPPHRPHGEFELRLDGHGGVDIGIHKAEKPEEKPVETK